MDQKKLADEWNRTRRVGTAVWAKDHRGEEVCGATRTTAMMVYGEAVVFLEGLPYCVRLDDVIRTTWGSINLASSGPAPTPDAA